MGSVALPFCNLELSARKTYNSSYPKALNTLGDHIWEVRLDHNFLQKDVALLTGTTTETVCNWETGKTEPEVRHLPKIMDFLGYCPCEPKQRTLGERLKALRIYLLGISQEVMAQKLGVDEGTLRRWEKGAEIRNRIARKRAIAFLAAGK